MDHRPLIVAVYFAFAFAELLRGHFRTRPITKDDWRLDLLSSGIIALMTSPAVLREVALDGSAWAAAA